MTTTESETDLLNDDLENNARVMLRHYTGQLAELRAERKAIDAKVRELVEREKRVKRIVAVFDRANAKLSVISADNAAKGAPAS